MNFNKNLVLWCVLLLTKHCVLMEVEECVQRRQGACKVQQLNPYGTIYLDDFHSPQPEGFLLKTSIEINLSENKHSYENNLPVEKKRTIGYNLNNAAIVTISIEMNDSSIQINLGKKYYRLAELQYYKNDYVLIEKKYSSYTPILPTFPYNLLLEITTNGTFAVYADVNTEPFLQYQLDNRTIVDNIGIAASVGQTDLIAFVDCSEKHKPNCGSYRINRLDGCREWHVTKGTYSIIRDLEGFQKTYEKDVLFDEFVVVDIADYFCQMTLWFLDSVLTIKFKDSSIKAEILIQGEFSAATIVKGAETTKWTEIPASPYAVRVLITNDMDNNRLTISNIRGHEILTVNLCGVKGSLESIHIYGPRFYFDCLNPDDERSKMMNPRPRKTNEKNDLGDLTYHENGYNFSKTLLDIRQYESEPFILYTHTFGNSTKDWCDGEQKPDLFVSSKRNDDTVQSVIKSSNKALLSELKKVNAQLNATADTNKALLSELETISNATADTKRAVADTNKALLSELVKLAAQISAQNNATTDNNKDVLSELQSVKASIDALAAHLERNTTTVNNYYNQLNVTEFLKLIKQN